MYKAVFITLLSVLSIGCATSDTISRSNFNYNSPENYSCPSSHFALCEGTQPSNLQCQCIDRQYQRNTIRSIQGLY